MLSLSFAFALLVSVAVKLWLGARQMRHVLSHRDSVPLRFREVITLEAHQKAADYTIARARLNAVYTLVEAVLLVA
jgi:STE24 endopeptidase